MANTSPRDAFVEHPGALSDVRRLRFEPHLRTGPRWAQADACAGDAVGGVPVLGSGSLLTGDLGLPAAVPHAVADLRPPLDPP